MIVAEEYSSLDGTMLVVKHFEKDRSHTNSYTLEKYYDK